MTRCGARVTLEARGEAGRLGASWHAQRLLQALASRPAGRQASRPDEPRNGPLHTVCSSPAPTLTGRQGPKYTLITHSCVYRSVSSLQQPSSHFYSKTDKGSADLYFHYYGCLQHQQNMLQDYIRTGAGPVAGGCSPRSRWL